jgi:hypothetical protein
MNFILLMMNYHFIHYKLQFNLAVDRMNTIQYTGTEDTPKIIFDKENAVFEISGRSLPENPLKFYQPYKAWVDQYTEDPNDYTEVVVNFDYFNSSSILQIYEMLLSFQKIIKKGKEVKIIWLHDKDDEFMMEEGIELQSVLKIPFEIKSY